jgi:hypothetical protein
VTVDKNGPKTPSTPSGRPPRPPAPVFAAAVLLGLYGLLTLFVAVSFASQGTLLLGVVGIVYVVSAYGLWRGNRIARVIVLVFAGLEAVGLVLALERLGTADLLRAALILTIAGLVLIPEAAKDWFAKH